MSNAPFCWRKTSDSKLLLVLRVLAGLVLLFFGVLHFVKMDAFADIMLASGLPLVGFNTLAAPVVEVLGGLLLIPGWYSRVGGLLAVFAMGPAIYATLHIHSLSPDKLPEGLEAIPTVPPLPLPIVTLVIGLVVVFAGGGAKSKDLAAT